MAITSTSIAVPVLFLFADTGGGHRNAAEAVSEALEEGYPGMFSPVLCDPLSGQGSSPVLRRIVRLYGPLIRVAPWAWGAVYRATDSRRVMGLLCRTLFALADRPVAHALAAHEPAAVVSFHPLTGGAAVRARSRSAHAVPVMTVVTDLVTSHTAWRYDQVDRIVVPSATVGFGCGLGGLGPERVVEIGLPVTSAFRSARRGEGRRSAVRRSRGLGTKRFVVVLAGGGEGAGGMAPRAAAIIRRLNDVDVVVLCGRNRRLERRMRRLAVHAGGRLTVKGFVDDMADWLACADVVVTKAGPGIIAEATCCGAALVLTSELPGQERGNVDFVVAAGAGRHVPGVRPLVAVIDQLRRDPTVLAAMRVASAALSRPDAALDMADCLAGLAGLTPALCPPADGPGSADTHHGADSRGPRGRHGLR